MSTIPLAQEHIDLPTGLTLGGIPVTGNPASDAAPVTFSTLTSPNPKAGASAFQTGFEPIPEDGGNHA